MTEQEDVDWERGRPQIARELGAEWGQWVWFWALQGAVDSPGASDHSARRVALGALKEGAGGGQG